MPEARLRDLADLRPPQVGLEAKTDPALSEGDRLQPPVPYRLSAAKVVAGVEPASRNHRS